MSQLIDTKNAIMFYSLMPYVFYSIIVTKKVIEVS